MIIYFFVKFGKKNLCFWKSGWLDHSRYFDPLDIRYYKGYNLLCKQPSDTLRNKEDKQEKHEEWCCHCSLVNPPVSYKVGQQNNVELPKGKGDLNSNPADSSELGTDELHGQDKDSYEDAHSSTGGDKSK